MTALRRRLANRLRLAADRIDPAGAPRALSWSFTFDQVAAWSSTGTAAAARSGTWATGTTGGRTRRVGLQATAEWVGLFVADDAGMTEAETAEALRVLAGSPRPDERRVLSTGREFQYDAARRLWNEAR